MDHLFTPWRMAYIRAEKDDTMSCVFCSAPALEDSEALIVARGTHHYVILNRYPYNNGHLMIVPYAHVTSPETMNANALLEMAVLTNQALAALTGVYRPSAFNLGANIGAAAGAGIAARYHFHIVPRWAGDANFMTVVGETRVVPDSLEGTWRAVIEHWEPPSAAASEESKE